MLSSRSTSSRPPGLFPPPFHCHRLLPPAQPSYHTFFPSPCLPSTSPATLSARRCSFAHIASPLKPLISCSISRTGSNEPNTEGDVCFSKKMVDAALLITAAVGLALITWSGSAIAGSQVAFPSISSHTSSRGRDFLVSAWMGLVAGCLHTLTGPDHLAALAPLSIGCSRLESAAVGALWGCGHDAGQMIFGILFILLKDKLQIDIIRTWGARIVGMTLLTIGAIGFKEAQEAAATAVPCIAGNVVGPVDGSRLYTNGTKKNIGFATFATGIVHGLQPDALIMILPALALPSRLAGAAFLTMFLFGTVLAMSGFTVFLGSCSRTLSKRVPRITQHLSWVSSLVAVSIGVLILASELFGLSIL